MFLTIYNVLNFRSNRIIEEKEMRNKKFVLILFSVLMLSATVLSACNLTNLANSGQNQQSAQQTAAMATVSAIMTQQAFETLVSQATQLATLPPTAVAGATALPPTSVPPTSVPPTAVPPTATPYPPTATPVPVPCNAAAFVKDISIPDGTDLAGGQKFTKTWRLQNVGTCTWTTDYDLVFVDGSAMSAPASVSLTGSVKPGESADISVDLVAPAKEGSYKGFWMLRDGYGNRFGLGKNASNSFWVSIDVTGFASDDVPSSIYPYDFVASICSATWDSNAGDVSLPCAGVDAGKAQWVAVEMNPVFEGGHVDNERTLAMHLNAKNDWMQGFYPASVIEDGEKFSAIVGCLEANKNCNATFSLDIKVDGGATQNLGKWEETYDGKYTRVSIDLSPYVGKKVQFILGVTNKNSSGNLDVFWFVPAIVK